MKVSNTNSYVLFIFLSLIIRHIYILFLSNNLMISAYFPLFGLLYATTYYLTKKTNLSLFTSLLATIGRTIYRYQSSDFNSINKLGIRNTILYIIGITIPFIVNRYKKTINNNYIDRFNFAALIYIFISCGEFMLHKYLMHCDRESNIIKMIKRIPIIGDELFSSCNTHINHHLDTEKDMNVDTPSSEDGLYMGWTMTVYLLLIMITVILISKSITGFDISKRMIIILSCVVTFIWQYIWNKVHVEMHNLENNYSIKKGPYDGGIFDLNLVTRLLFTNHTNHHLQKGDKKGNFNVIVLGADEWFNYNVRTPDNVEYCKTNKQDTACN